MLMICPMYATGNCRNTSACADHHINTHEHQPSCDESGGSNNCPVCIEYEPILKPSYAKLCKESCIGVDE